MGKGIFGPRTTGPEPQAWAGPSAARCQQQHSRAGIGSGGGINAIGLAFHASRNAPLWKNPLTVILTTGEDIEIWMTAPAQDALKLQRPLPDGALKIVARDEKKDGE